MYKASAATEPLTHQEALDSYYYVLEGWKTSLDWIRWANALVFVLLVLHVVVLWWWDKRGQKTPGFDSEMRWRVFLPWCIGFGWGAFYLLFIGVDFQERFDEFLGDVPKGVDSLILGLPQAIPFILAGWTLLARKRRIYGPLGSFLPIDRRDKSLRDWRPRPAVVIVAGITVMLGSLIAAASRIEVTWLDALNVFLPVFSLGLLGAGLFRLLNFRSFNIDSAMPGVVLMLYAVFQYVQLWVPVEQGHEGLWTHGTGPAFLVALFFKASLFFSLLQISITLGKVRNEKIRDAIKDKEEHYPITMELSKTWRRINDEVWHKGQGVSLFPSGRLHNPKNWQDSERQEHHPRLLEMHDRLNNSLRGRWVNIKNLPGDCVGHDLCWHFWASKSMHRCNFDKYVTRFLVAHFFCLLNQDTWESCARCRAMEEEIFVVGVGPGQLVWAMSKLIAEEAIEPVKHRHEDGELHLVLEFEVLNRESFLLATRGEAEEGTAGGLTQAMRMLQSLDIDRSMDQEGEGHIGRIAFTIPTRRI